MSFLAICIGLTSTAAHANNPALAEAILVCEYQASTFCGIEGRHSQECIPDSNSGGASGQIDLNLKERTYRLTTAFRGMPVSNPIGGTILNQIRKPNIGYSSQSILFLSSGQIVTVDETSLLAVVQHARGGAAITAIYQCKHG